MNLIELVRTSTAVGATVGRLEKISKLAALLKRLEPDEVPIGIGFLTGWPRQGRIGIGWSTVASARDHTPSTEPILELRDVDRALDELQSVKGKRSAAERTRLLTELFSRATAEEQQFLMALAIGEVRQGALEGVLLEAVAKAAGLPGERVRRAVMLAETSARWRVLSSAPRGVGGAKRRCRVTRSRSSDPYNRCSPTQRLTSMKR